MTTATGLQLLLSDSHGVNIPRRFALAFDLPAFGIAEDDEDVAILLKGADHEHYWDAWDAVMNKAKTAEGGYLYQDGDLWLVHPHLMDDEEYVNFFGENPPVPDGWTEYAACTHCVVYIANADLSGLDDTEAAHIENMCNALPGYATATSITYGFRHANCEICGALAGDRYRVLVKDDEV